MACHGVRSMPNCPTCISPPSCTARRYLYSDASELLRYVWTTWPYWNRTAGARHLLLSTSESLSGGMSE